jgi:hypothetical protein
MEYVVPLKRKMAAGSDRLGDYIQAGSTSAQAKRLHKERDKLTKQLDEQLRHSVHKPIAADLDDVLKINYGKFDDSLAEVTAVYGG